jgi:Na+/proline symporter
LDYLKKTFFVCIALFIGLLIIFLAFIASYLGDNIIVIVFQIAGSMATPILGVYLLGFFAPRVNSRVSALGKILLLNSLFFS